MSRDQWLVHCLSVLGILDLEGPKGPNERAVDAMFAVGSVLAPRHAIEAIHKAGLKIVEN